MRQPARPRSGSSPLTRGKHPATGVGAAYAGLIPAHAGKTRIATSVWSLSTAHPRSRGENVVEPVWTNVSTGSSPLTRGKHSRGQPSAAIVRLIPAHAGKTPWTQAAPGDLLGSSPLTRGKHFLTCAFIAQIGQILESLELCASSESYSSPEAYATDALQGRVRSIDLGLRSSRGAS